MYIYIIKYELVCTSHICSCGFFSVPYEEKTYFKVAKVLKPKFISFKQISTAVLYVNTIQRFEPFLLYSVYIEEINRYFCKGRSPRMLTQVLRYCRI